MQLASTNHLPNCLPKLLNENAVDHWYESFHARKYWPTYLFQFRRKLWRNLLVLPQVARDLKIKKTSPVPAAIVTVQWLVLALLHQGEFGNRPCKVCQRMVKLQRPAKPQITQLLESKRIATICWNAQRSGCSKNGREGRLTGKFGSLNSSYLLSSQRKAYFWTSTWFRVYKQNLKTSTCRFSNWTVQQTPSHGFFQKQADHCGACPLEAVNAAKTKPAAIQMKSLARDRIRHNTG